MSITNLSSQKKSALIKMIMMIVVILGGFTVVVLGFNIFNTEPSLKTHHSFNDDIKLDSDFGDFRIVFNSNGGFYPGRNIDPFIQLTFHEQIVNSSNIQVIINEGRIVSELERRYVSTHNEPVTLNFEGTTIQLGVNMSNYIANPYLVYDFSGKYGASIKIDKQNGSKPFETSWPNVVEIESWEDYRNKRDGSNALGLPLMIAGIALIATAPTFAKFFEYLDEYKK